MPNATKGQKIAQFNQKQQQKAAGAAPVNPTPGQPLLIPKSNMSADDIALIEKANSGATLTQEETIAFKAMQTKANLKHTEDEQKRREEEAEEQQKRDEKLHEAAIHETGKAISRSTAPAVNWFQGVPTPGGLATILILLFVFLMAIVPANPQGDTRLKLVWLTLTGKTHLRYQDDPFNQPGAQGAGGTFGNQPATPPSAVPPTNGTTPLVQGTAGLNLTGVDLFNLFSGQ